jgi:non-ribosomal peptide synthetase component F
VIRAEEHDRPITRRLPPTAARADATIVELFEQQAAANSGAIAILHRERRLTYGELNAQANRLAWVLTGKGVGPEQVVALCLARSPEWIATMLAVSKAGGACRPRSRLSRGPPSRPDPAEPRDSSSRRSAERRWLASLLRCSGRRTARARRQPEANLPLAAPGNLAHVFFTSGSTGRPKGVATSTAT